MKVIICTWRIREWELQILNWSSSVQPEIVPLFTISFQCLKKKFKSWQVYDWLAKWLIMSGYMDLRRPRVYRRSNVGLVHFYPSPVLAFGYCHRLRLCVCPCVCVSLCVNHLLVRAITWEPFKLGSPNLDQRCKRPWLRSLLFCGAIDLDLQGQI